MCMFSQVESSIKGCNIMIDGLSGSNEPTLPNFVFVIYQRATLSSFVTMYTYGITHERAQRRLVGRKGRRRGKDIRRGRERRGAQ